MDIVIPKIVEYVKTEQLSKNRVRLTLTMFLMNDEMFDQIVAAYSRGEISTVEVRVGVATKHPIDKWNKKVGMDLARTRTVKKNLKIKSIDLFVKGEGRMFLEGGYTVRKLSNGKIRVYSF